MSEFNSTLPAKPSKPAKPDPEFPLYAHASGRWAKKIKGKVHYFGPWNDPQGALQRYRDFLNGKRAVKSKPPAADDPRPKKPHPEFPLYAHASGRWAKKIRGQIHYFGPWSDPDGALDKYVREKEALHDGRKPRPDTGAPTIKDVCNEFLNAKRELVESGELSERTLRD